MIKRILLLLPFIIHLQILAQVQIQGLIVDHSDNSPIQNANIRLYNEINEPIGYTFSNENGIFNLDVEFKKKIILKVSALRYKQEDLEIITVNENINLNIEMI